MAPDSDFYKLTVSDCLGSNSIFFRSFLAPSYVPFRYRSLIRVQYSTAIVPHNSCVVCCVYSERALHVSWGCEMFPEMALLQVMYEIMGYDLRKGNFKRSWRTSSMHGHIQRSIAQWYVQSVQPYM